MLGRLESRRRAGEGSTLEVEETETKLLLDSRKDMIKSVNVSGCGEGEVRGNRKEIFRR